MLAVVDPAATVALAGTLTFALPLVSPTAKPPAGAAPLKVTVQVEAPGALTLAGLQLRPFKLTGTTIDLVMVPPVPVVAMAVPEAEAARALVTPIFVVLTPVATFTLRTATVPLPIGVVFVPKSTQVTVPEA
jgi:hypothetical protein